MIEKYNKIKQELETIIVSLTDGVWMRVGQKMGRRREKTVQNI